MRTVQVPSRYVLDLGLIYCYGTVGVAQNWQGARVCASLPLADAYFPGTDETKKVLPSKCNAGVPTYSYVVLYAVRLYRYSCTIGSTYTVLLVVPGICSRIGLRPLQPPPCNITAITGLREVSRPFAAARVAVLRLRALRGWPPHHCLVLRCRQCHHWGALLAHCALQER